jgi:Transposase DDE domain
MSEPTPARRGRRPKPKPRARDIQGAKYLVHILDLLAPLHAHCADPKRQFHFDQYCAWLLLYFFTPILDSMRGLQQASGLESIQRKLGLSRFSLGSFSEAGTVFDPQLLVPIMEQIGARLDDIEPDGRLRALARRPTAVDGTLLHALPKMVWALWLDEANHAAKLHLQFDLLRGVPQQATLSAAQASETRTLQRRLEPGRLYVADRGYFDYDLLAAILAAQSSFLTRVHDNIAYDVLHENPIGAADAKAGVELDARVRVGSKSNQDKFDRPLRLVRIAVADTGGPSGRPNRVDAKTKMFRTRQTDHTLTLLTDQLDLDVSLLALLYRQRWQIELFFRWFKKVLAADRLLALSQNGMTIVVYCALIASMLVVLWTGKKPTKRTFELLCFYFAGWASDEDVRRHLERLAPAEKIA